MLPKELFDIKTSEETYNALELNHHHSKHISCKYCARVIGVRAGLIDMMSGPPPYNTAERELELTIDILKWSEECDFSGTVTNYIHTHTYNSLDIKQIAIQNRIDSVNRGSRMLQVLESMSDQAGYISDYSKEKDLGTLLDFGCGVGGQLIASAGRAEQLIGIDAALTELALARRNLLDHGRDKDVQLIATYAEELPLPRCSVDTIIMRDTIEHFKDQQLALQRAWRVLKPGGRMLLNSPNRYMLWHPEPHVQLYMMGFMPRNLMPWYVKKRVGTPYEGCRLLGLWELKKMIRSLRPKPKMLVWKGNPPVGAQAPEELEWAEDYVMNEKLNNKSLLRWFSPEHTFLLVK